MTPKRFHPPGAATTAAALALFLVVLPSALAHGYQESSTPAPNSRFSEAPSEVVVRMTEPVEVGQTTVRVFDANGTNHASGALTSETGTAQSSVLIQPVELPGNGTYTVTWKTLWVSDGHITEGAFAFVVGNETTLTQVTTPATGAVTPGLAEVAFRALGFSGWIVAAGVLVFPGLVSEPALRGHALADEARDILRRRSANVAMVAAFVAFVAAAGSLLDQSVRTGFGFNFAALASATTIGKVLFARLAFAAVLVVAAVRVHRTRQRAESAVVIALAGLLTLTLGSHARAADVRIPGTSVLDYVHLLAASLWIGTLVGVLLTLPFLLARVPREARGGAVGPLVGRVSLMATLSVAALVLTGTIAGIIHLGALDRLFATLYGRVLLLKLGLVGLLLALGFVNRQFFVPAYQRSDGLLPEGRLGIQRFRSVVVTEVTLMALVLATTGALAGISPQEQAVFTPTSINVEAEGREFAAALMMTPGAVGVNHVIVNATTAEGSPLLDAKALTLSLFYLSDEQLPPVETLLEETAPGMFEGNVTIGFAGEWLVTAKLQRETTYDDSADFFITID